jgi:sulfate adenylyltransferase
MSNLVPPHGADSLKPLLLPETERVEEAKRAERLTQVPLSSREVSDLFMLGMGAYTPLDGFMGEADWRGCCEHMTLSNGIFWPIPITLSCAQELGDSIGIGEDVALTDGESGELLGILTVEEKYGIDREFECSHVFRTTDTAHPGVDKVMQQGPVNLGGPVRTLSEGHFPETYAGFYHRPAETRALFQERGWSKVAAFQTRNPMHRSHEHLAKIAIEICDRRYSGGGAGPGHRRARQ